MPKRKIFKESQSSLVDEYIKEESNEQYSSCYYVLGVRLGYGACIVIGICWAAILLWLTW